MNIGRSPLLGQRILWCNSCHLNISITKWPAAYLKQYLRPRYQVSVFILKIKCSLNLLVSYVCFDICGGIERALSRGHPARMQFPQALCPLGDKRVIRNCNQGLISFVVSKFTQNCLSHAKQLFLYGYGFRHHVSCENDHWKWNFCKTLSRKTLFPMCVTTDENRTFRKRCLVTPDWDSNLTPKNLSAEQSPTLRVPMYNLCFCNLTL